MIGVERFQPGGEGSVGCRGQCPLNTAVLLGEMAGQLVRPREWLLAAGGETAYGVFSENALRAVVHNFEVEAGPSCTSYGWRRGAADDILDTHSIQTRLVDGENLTAKDILTLRRGIVSRNQRRDRFAALPARRRQELFTAARLLMEDDLVVGVADEYPETTGDPRFAGLLAAREAKGPITEADHGLGREVALVAYTFDQSPFLVAGYALQQCSGPWHTLTEPVFRRPAPTQVCPHGSPRGDLYSRAAASAGGEVHPG